MNRAGRAGSMSRAGSANSVGRAGSLCCANSVGRAGSANSVGRAGSLCCANSVGRAGSLCSANSAGRTLSLLTAILLALTLAPSSACLREPRPEPPASTENLSGGSPSGGSPSVGSPSGTDPIEDINSDVNVSDRVICVDGSWTGAQEGTEAKPFRTIQAAIDAASDSRIDTIRVAQGTYREAVRISQKKVHLLGGYKGSGDFTSADLQERRTVIEGTPDAPCIWINIDARKIPGSLVISGLTIRRGQHGIELSGAWSGNLDNIIIKNNIIEENDARNAASKRGGGIALEGDNVTIRGNVICNNKADRGAAIGGTSECLSNFLIADNHIMNNSGYGDHAGAVLINGTGTITRNIFEGNVIDAAKTNGYGWGGGITIVNYDTKKLITLSYNIWRNNHAPSCGGAIFVDEAAYVRMEHELIYNNTSGERGAAVYVDEAWTHEPSILYMDNCTVSGNRSTRGASGGSSGGALLVQASQAFVLNCIFWDNGKDFEVIAGGHLSVEYTLTQQGFTGTGNISSDPLFANASAGDFHVKSSSGRFDPATGTFTNDTVNSPAIDAGKPSSDFSKEPKPNGGRINLGCYGNTAEASKSPGG